MLSMILAILPFALKLGNLWLDKKGASNEEKVKFLEDFTAMQKKIDAAVVARKQGLGVLGQMDEFEKQRLKEIQDESKQKGT